LIFIGDRRGFMPPQLKTNKQKLTCKDPYPNCIFRASTQFMNSPTIMALAAGGRWGLYFAR
jgi:hypothetical protein